MHLVNSLEEAGERRVADFSLRYRELMRLPDAARLSVQCLAGTAWLTHGCSRDDVIVPAGTRVEIDDARGTVVQALRGPLLRLRIESCAARSLVPGTAVMRRDGLNP